MTLAPWGKYNGPQGAKKKIKEYKIFFSSKQGSHFALVFMSNQDSQLDKVWYGDRYWSSTSQHWYMPHK